MGPWFFIQPSGCGISRPLWQSAQRPCRLAVVAASAQSRGVTLPVIGTLVSSGGTPPTWQTLQSSGSCLPSWQRAQIDILFWDTARDLELRARMRDVGVAGEALVAGLAQALWLTRMLSTTWSRSICDLG